MAGKVVGRVFALPETIVKGFEKFLLVALANYCGDDGRGAYARVATLAKDITRTERQTRRLLRRLEDRGLIAEDAPPRQHRARTWRLVLPQGGHSYVRSEKSTETSQADRQGGHFARQGGHSYVRRSVN
jgi:hypothetical protein